jgi:hypothetical protein
MDPDIQSIVIPVNQLNGFLDLAVDINFLKTTEFADPMIDMNNIITRIKSCELFDGKTFLTGEIAFDPEFVIPVKDLMIGKQCCFNVMIDKTTVQIN